MNGHGTGDFAAFFSSLNAERGTADFRETDAALLRKFAAQFLPDRLPAAYLEFMRYAGNGLFWVGSDCDFQTVPELREWAKELLAENSFPLPLPDDAFPFRMHQGYMFWFFRLSEGDDPPVYFYTEERELTDFIRVSDSFTGFIMKHDGDCRTPV